MADEPILLLDLETRLAEDEDGSYRDSLVQQLALEGAALRRELLKGLPPEEFRVLDALGDAIDAAADVVKGVWSRHNARRT